MTHVDPRNVGLARPRTRPPGADRDIRAVVLMFAFNEGDVIHHVIGGAIEQGCEVYLLDNCSTDDTVEQASPWLGKGLIDIERFPGEGMGTDHVFNAKDILRRCEELSVELGAEWYVLSGADEFRESPWPDLTLREGIAFADTLGYNAIQYEAIVFRPMDDNFPHGADVRDHLVHWEPTAIDSVLCVSTWKAGPYRADLVSLGGHVAQIPDRRVFPIPFIVRHYQLRGATHGRRKIFEERVPRFAQDELEAGWHIHYDGYVEGAGELLWNPDTLTEWDPVRFRADLLSRYSRDAVLLTATTGLEPATSPFDAQRLSTWLSRAMHGGQTPSVAEIEDALRTTESLLSLQMTDRSVPSLPPATAELLSRLLDVNAAQRSLVGDTNVERHMGALRALLDRDAAIGALLLEARGTVVVAFADELAERPELVASYAKAVGPADDVTLLIYAPDENAGDVAGRLEPVLEAAGAGDDGPDMLLHAAPAGQEALLALAAGFLLSGRPASGPLGDVPRLDAASARELRERMPLPRLPMSGARLAA